MRNESIGRHYARTVPSLCQLKMRLRSLRPGVISSLAIVACLSTRHKAPTYYMWTCVVQLNRSGLVYRFDQVDDVLLCDVGICLRIDSVIISQVKRVHGHDRPIKVAKKIITLTHLRPIPNGEKLLPNSLVIWDLCSSA